MNIKEHKGKIFVGAGIVSILLAVVISVSVVSAQSGSFLSQAAKAFGAALAEKVDVPADLLKGVFEPFAGAEGDTFSSGKKAVGIASPDSTDTISSTTPMVSIQNTSGVERIITSCFAYFEDTSGWSGIEHEQGAGTTLLTFTTSTSATGTSTPAIYSRSFASSTNEVVQYTSSTIGFNITADGVPVDGGEGWKRKWADDEYLNIYVDQSVSSTEAMAGCEYELFN